MTPPNNRNRKERLLLRFIRQVGEQNETPSLIVLIAKDTDYLKLCRSIVDPTAESDIALFKTLSHVCRNIGMNPQGLKERLMPAARALGLVQSLDSLSDYYQLLGVRPQADTQEIKEAFRRKVVRVHPDANANLTDGSRQFVELNDAYRTLRDPVLRLDYDIQRHHLSRWREYPTWTFSTDRRPTLFWWYFSGLVFIFILIPLILNIIVF